MVKNDKEIIAKLTSLEALLQAGLSECHRLREMIEGGVSTSPTGHKNALSAGHIAQILAARKKALIVVKQRMSEQDLINASKDAVDKRKAFFKKKSNKP